MGRLRVVIHLATACAVLALAVAVGRWLRDPVSGGPLLAILAPTVLVGLCAHRLYRHGGVARRPPAPTPTPTTRVALTAPVTPVAVPPPLWMTADLLDLNHADARELQTLPGVGKVTAERIVQERERGGPFGSVDDLARVGGLGPARIRTIAERVRTS